MTAVKLGIVSAIVAASVVTLLMNQYWANAQFRKRNETLRQQEDQWAQLKAENKRLSNFLVQAQFPRPLSGEEFKELMRLRSEVGLLRQPINLMQKFREENRQLQARLTAAQSKETHPSREDADEELSAETIEAMKTICLELQPALQRFANDHNHKPPRELLDLRNYFTDSGKPVIGLYTFQFVPNTPPSDAPAGALIMREIGSRRKPDGKWARVYAFGDGRVVEATSDDGNYDQWEIQHIVPSSSGQP